MGSPGKRSPNQSQSLFVYPWRICPSENQSSEAGNSFNSCKKKCRQLVWGRMFHAKCTTRSHNSSIFFSLGKGLILILLLFYWISSVQGKFPGRHGRPPLLPHPLGGRSPLFNRRSHPPPPHLVNGPRKPPPNGQSDLAVAAQTLYDLRGYHHVPLSGPDNARFHRQNDPFTLPTPLASNPRPRGVNPQQDTRTAPLVFPSFYQEQPTPTPTRSSIFGHNQHLSQTRFEPPAGFHLGGNSASGKITFEQQSASSRDRFRPSQIDISLHNPLNQVQSTPASNLAEQPKVIYMEKKEVPTTRGRGPTSDRGRQPPIKLSKSQQQDPFVYVYDEVEYDDGEDDFTFNTGNRAPQNQINANRITPSTTTTVAPLRGREPTIVPSPSPFPPPHHVQQQQPFQHHVQQIFSTTTQPTKSTTQNSLFYVNQKDDFVNNNRDLFNNHGIHRPPVTATPRPNVEIVPSSERKPPPDQSNAISPIVRINNGRDFSRPIQHAPQVPQVSDEHRTRRPTQSTSTSTGAPPPQAQIQPQFQREAIFPQQQQGRQVPASLPVPYFPAGLDRRPGTTFEANNEIQSNQGRGQGQTRNHFDQVVNVLQEEEEEEEEYPQNNAVITQGQAHFESGFNNPSKLRPVNTIIPKNRIPKEDILLPPNFPYLGADLTTTLTPLRDDFTRTRGDITQQRVRENHVTRIREEVPKIRDEVPRVQPQRVVPTQSQVRTRPPVVHEDELDENRINQQEGAPPSAPSRVRGQPGRQHTVRTTTTTHAPPPLQEVPSRARTVSPRQRLRPNYNRPAATTTPATTTTTTTTTTTPVPTYVEYPSQEYLDEYDNPPQPLQPSRPPPEEPTPPKSLRFPPFPKKEAEEPVTPVAPVQRHRPTVEAQERPVQPPGRQRPVKPGRFRETTTPSGATSPRTTGKPLYTTGKMLSKEGGLYAGQQISTGHVYGSPVPNMPINSILDKVPGLLDGRVILATTKPSFGSPQKHLRAKQRTPEHGPPSRINPSHRLRPVPTARPQQEHSLDIVETVTLRPYQNDKSKAIDEPKRLSPGSQFIRGQSTSSEKPEGTPGVPRRRKVITKTRPGQRRQQQTPQDPYTETVSIHPEERDEEERPIERVRSHVRESIAPTASRVESTTEGSLGNSPSPRSRRPRPPRPGKLNIDDISSTSEKSPDVAEIREDESPRPAKPVRKIRPRLRPVPQLTPQQQRGSPSEVVTQSSAQVDRKPTDAPGRFSSRFREESFGTTTVAAPTQSIRGEDEDRESGPGRFSPPTSRPTFKPPPKKNQPRRKPVQEAPQDDDDLPDSIKLSPKDVIANRKPARRIPPGSASDRLKALAERRKKVFGSEQEEVAEGQIVVKEIKRPRKPFNQDEEAPASHLPRPLRLRRPQPSTEHEVTGPKREIVQRLSPQKLKNRNEVDYDNEENKENVPNDDNENDDNEYTNDELSSTSPASVRLQSNFVVKKAPRPGSAFQRNRSVEVTSDEARSVLGIPRPAAPFRHPPKKRVQDDEEKEEQPEYSNSRQRQRGEEDVPSEFNTVTPYLQKQGLRQREREQLRPLRPFQLQPQEDIDDSEEDKTTEYEDEEEKVEQTPRRIRLHSQQHIPSTSSAPFRMLHKKLNTGRPTTEEIEQSEEEAQPNDTSERTTVSTSSSTTTSVSSSTSPSTPLALPIRAGPQPIKQGKLGNRLRPNRKLILSSGGDQPRVSVSRSSTSTEASQEKKQAGLKHGTIHVSKSLQSRLRSSTEAYSSGGRNHKTFVAMATDNPSLPLESIFPEVA